MIGQRGMKRGSSGPPIRYDAVERCLAKLGDEAIRLTFLRTGAGEPTQIEIQEYDNKRKIARIGPLPHTMTPPAKDPDPARTAAIRD